MDEQTLSNSNKDVPFGLLIIKLASVAAFVF